MTVYGRRQQTLIDYDGFVEKFKPKKTTDDCITPEPVYEAVRDWAAAEFSLEGREVVRPFWPGGDYETFDYPDGCVVIDNPPFSILSVIVRFYNANGVDFFLFAPHLSVFSPGRYANIVLCGSTVIYGNGARVNTSFVTSLGAYKIRNAPKLYEAIAAAQSKSPNAKKRSLPTYEWPEEILRSTDLDCLTANGIEYSLTPEECTPIAGDNIESLLKLGKSIFGGGYFISKAKAKAKTIVVTLSPQEAALVEALGSAEDEAVLT